MATTKKISQLANNPSTPLTGSELLPIVQDGITYNIALASVAAMALRDTDLVIGAGNTGWVRLDLDSEFVVSPYAESNQKFIRVAGDAENIDEANIEISPGGDTGIFLEPSYVQIYVNDNQAVAFEAGYVYFGGSIVKGHVVDIQEPIEDNPVTASGTSTSHFTNNAAADTIILTIPNGAGYGTSYSFTNTTEVGGIVIVAGENVALVTTYEGTKFTSLFENGGIVLTGEGDHVTLTYLYNSAGTEIWFGQAYGAGVMITEPS